MSKTMVLVGGQWVEKPVMFGYPDWRTTPPPQSNVMLFGMYKRRIQIVFDGTGSQHVTLWNAYSDTAHPSTISESYLMVPSVPTKQYRVRAKINGVLRDDPSSSLRSAFYIELRRANGTTTKVIDRPTATNTGELGEMSAVVTLASGDGLALYAYRDTWIWSYNDENPNYVIVEDP